MINKKTIAQKLLLILFLSINFVYAGDTKSEIPITENGTIKYWYLAGPFEQPIVGFGDPADKEIIEEEKDGNLLQTNSELNWIPKLVNENNFVDINDVFKRSIDETPSKIWNAKAAYAFTIINSEKEQNVKLLFGGNSISKVIVNGELIYTNQVIKNAVADEVEKEVKLRKGKNYIFVKAFNTHKNYSVTFFLPVNFEWGFYFRIQPGDNSSKITEILNPDEIKNDFTLTPTFFQKEIEGQLQQKVYVDVVSDLIENTKALLTLKYDENEITNSLDLGFGHNYFEVYIPVIKEKTELNSSIEISGIVINKKNDVEPPKKYELHLMLLSHTDIGYTNPQPVVKEKHIKTLEEAIAKAKSDVKFKWTIETVWQIEQYRKAKSEEDFLELIELIKEGRIAVSPLYANPFTGWISEMEAIESFSIAAELKKKYGIDYNSVVYNDVPGESWFMAQLFESAGIHFLSNGINEIFNDYQLQRNLPKVFMWEGSNSSKVINYLNQSYVEGKEYGLTRGGEVIEARVWEKINKIKKDYDYEMILLNAAFTDNAGIAINQYNNAIKWNEEFTYPRFVISTLSEFAGEFYEKYKDELPVVKNDFTSAWDILNQGEPGRSIKLRWTQNNINSAAKLTGSLWLAENDFTYNSDLYNSVFDNTLQFSGHGSGMEYGFGNAFENYVTDAYRQNYIDNAYLGTEELLQRSMYLLTKPMESLAGFGLVVFNPLSHSRDEIITAEFSALENADYSVVDLSTGETLNSFYKGSAISFFTKDLPGLGYKKFRFVRNDEASPKEEIAEDSSIENDYFKIDVDKQNGDITKIFNKVLNKNIIVSSKLPLLTLIKDVLGKAQNEKIIQSDNAKIEITKNNLYQKITFKDKYDLMPLIEIVLYKGIESIDIKIEFNLRKLHETGITENYNLVFPVTGNDSDIFLDLLGNEYNSKLHPEWIGHQSYSIRDYVRVVNNDYQVTLVSPEARVVTIDKDEKGTPFIEVNLANNFPKHWNRNEKNDEVLVFNFALKTCKATGGKLQAVNFGEEISSPSLIRKTWFGDEEPVDKFVSISNPQIKLKSIKPDGDKIIFVMQNVGEDSQRTKIQSEYFSGKTFSLLNVWGEKLETVILKENGELELSFENGEIKYLEIARDN